MTCKYNACQNKNDDQNIHYQPSVGYVCTPFIELPDEVYEQLSLVGDRLGLIVTAILLSGSHAEDFMDMLHTALSNLIEKQLQIIREEMDKS